MKRKKYSNGGNVTYYKSLNDLNVSFKSTPNNQSSLIINKPIGNKANINAFYRKNNNLPTEKNINFNVELGKGFSAYGGKTKKQGSYYGISFKKKF